jgi:hypothetical protein
MTLQEVRQKLIGQLEALLGEGHVEARDSDLIHVHKGTEAKVGYVDLESKQSDGIEENNLILEIKRKIRTLQGDIPRCRLRVTGIYGEGYVISRETDFKVYRGFLRGWTKVSPELFFPGISA